MRCKIMTEFYREHSNAFFESGCRCEICDSFGKLDIPVKFPFICQDCRNKKQTKIILEKRRIAGLIEHFTKQISENYKELSFNSNKLNEQLKAMEEIEKSEGVAKE